MLKPYTSNFTICIVISFQIFISFYIPYWRGGDWAEGGGTFEYFQSYSSTFSPNDRSVKSFFCQKNRFTKRMSISNLRVSTRILVFRLQHAIPNFNKQNIRYFWFFPYVSNKSFFKKCKNFGVYVFFCSTSYFLSFIFTKSFRQVL